MRKCNEAEIWKWQRGRGREFRNSSCSLPKTKQQSKETTIDHQYYEEAIRPGQCTTKKFNPIHDAGWGFRRVERGNERIKRLEKIYMELGEEIRIRNIRRATHGASNEEIKSLRK